MTTPSGIVRLIKERMMVPESGERIGKLLNGMLDGVASVTFTVGDEESNAITVNCQAKNEVGDAVDQATVLDLLLLADAAGAAFNSVDYTTIAAGTDGALTEVVADKFVKGITESDGSLDVTITKSSGAATCYLAAVGPNGKIIGISSEITHAE